MGNRFGDCIAKYTTWIFMVVWRRVQRVVRKGKSAALEVSDKEHIRRKYADIYRVVRRIPAGTVATYGQVADLAGMPRAARVVGVAMRASTPALGLPWQRVVGKRSRFKGQVSIHDPVGAGIQRSMLENEGVEFSASGAVCLRAFGWLPIDE